MTKYFFTERAGTPVAGQRFVIHDIVGGTAVGTFETEDPDLIKQLEILAKDKKSPVIEISKEDFDQCRKKKPPGPDSWNPMSVQSPTLIPRREEARAEAVDESNPIVAPEVGSIAEVLNVSRIDVAPEVAAPAPEAEPVKVVHETHTGKRRGK